MLTAWNAFPMLDRLFDDVMDDVTGKAFGTAKTQSTYNPAIDVRTNDDQIVFVCDVPGLKREDLEITLEAGVLSIKGQRRYEGNENDRVLLGRAYGAFANQFTLPDYVDAEHMTADLADGVLTITIPKLPKAKPRRIEIGAANGGKQLGEKKD
jgi:HSP20 family protein